MSNIGGLFKEFNTNVSFQKYLNLVDSKDEIILTVCQDEDLMTCLRSYCNNDQLIKDKMLVSIHQQLSNKIKQMNKVEEKVEKVEKPKEVEENDEPSEKDEEKESEDNYEKDETYVEFFQKSVIINNTEKACWITPLILIDPPIDIKKDPRIRMVTPDYEMFY